eukprot:gene29322-35398_t
MPLHVATHPLIAHKMTRLRDAKTSSTDFRKLLKEITFYLGYEATRELSLQSDPVTTPMNVPFDGHKLAEDVAIIPVLRAGLSMCDGMLDLMPRAAVHHIGMYRQKDSLLPIQYYNRLPKNEKCDVAFIVDPCIGRFHNSQSHIYIGAVDPTLSANGMILPGIGDAGDRQFRTPSDHVAESEAPATPGKRARDADDSHGKSPKKK